MSFPGSSVVNNPPANAGHTGNSGSVPGLERSPGGGNGNPLVRGNPLEKEWHPPLEEEIATPSSILAWKIPWTEELGFHGVGK